MLKQKSIILLLISLAIIMSLLYNCDKDENPTKPTVNELVGTWKLTKLTIISSETTVISEAQLNLMGAYWTIKLKSDNTFESDYNLDNHEIESGTWNTSGNKLTVTFDSGGTDTFEYSLAGNVLTLEWTDVEDGVEETLIGEFKKQ